MATTRNRPDELSTNEHSTVAAITRHDLVLAVIPSAFIVAMLVGQVVSLSTQASVALASIVGALALFDALFLNPPTSGVDE